MDTLIFDIGNVVVHFDFTTAGNRMAERSSADADPMKLLAPLKQKLESGAIAGPDFISKAIDTIGFQGSHDEFSRLWENIFSPNLPMWDSIAKLRGRYPLYLLSNTSDLHKASLFRDFDIFQSFDGGVYSFSARSEKPHPEIYRTAIAELGLDPAKTLYIDDLQENVVAGRAAGFVSHHYHPDHHDLFLAAARGHGFDV